MKCLSLAILLLSFASFSSGQTASISGSGDEATIFLGSNGSLIFLMVTNGTDTFGNPGTLLSYRIMTPNPDGTTTTVIGFGNIPNDAFTDQGPSKMSLNVDTSQVAGFSTTTCIFTPNFTCSSIPGGPVQITWRANGLLSEANTAHSVTTTGPVTEKIEGHGSASSADAQGFLPGFTISSTGSAFEAGISSGHTHTITITKN